MSNKSVGRDAGNEEEVCAERWKNGCHGITEETETTSAAFSLFPLVFKCHSNSFYSQQINGGS